MNRREKIIVGLMVLAVMYGAFALFIEPRLKAKGKESAGRENAALQEFVQQISTMFSASGGSEEDRYVLAAAEREWGKDPFVEGGNRLTDKPSTPEAGTEPAANQPAFSYTGYVRMGDRDLAIISGQEYESGDRIEATGHIIGEITPTRVVLRSPSGGPEVILVLEQER